MKIDNGLIGLGVLLLAIFLAFLYLSAVTILLTIACTRFNKPLFSGGFLEQFIRAGMLSILFAAACGFGSYMSTSITYEIINNSNTYWVKDELINTAKTSAFIFFFECYSLLLIPSILNNFDLDNKRFFTLTSSTVIVISATYLMMNSEETASYISFADGLSRGDLFYWFQLIEICALAFALIYPLIKSDYGDEIVENVFKGIFNFLSFPLKKQLKFITGE